VVEWVDNWGNSGMQLNNCFCWGNHRIFNGEKKTADRDLLPTKLGIYSRQNWDIIIKKNIG
jgi:hypothetical protein